MEINTVGEGLQLRSFIHMVADRERRNVFLKDN